MRPCFFRLLVPWTILLLALGALTRPGEAQATTQRFTLAGGGEWAQVVAMTISATTANVVKMSGVDGTHK